MMRRPSGLIAILALAGAVGPILAQPATPLRMEYCVEFEPATGLYEYTFWLILDDATGNWAPGQGWRWLIFGDEPGTCCGGTGISPLTNFVGDPGSLPVGPWTSYSSSSGGHNGPTMAPVQEYWTPSAVGETLTWKGTSTVDVPEPQMRFSTISGTLGGGVAADWNPMVRINCGAPPCYADCDGDEILSVDDFTCFINEFAAASALPHAQQVEHYANCDGSTTMPALTVDDFTCYINEFAAGCP